MNRNEYFKAVIFSILVFFAGCSFGVNPKEVLSKYIENGIQGNYDKAYEYLSSTDKAVKNKQEYLTDFEKFGGYANAFAGKITFNIKEVKVTGEKALATVDFKLPATTHTSQIDLVKEKDGWRVYMGWEHEKKIKELKAVAEKLDRQKNFAESKAKYSEILALSSRDYEAPTKIKELDEKIVKYKEKQPYFQNIEVRNVRIGKMLNGTGVQGELKNKGDRSLKLIEVTTYCLDKEGKVVFEKKFDAVHVPKTYSDLAIMFPSSGHRTDKPLKPNYSEQFHYELNDAPSDWSGKVRVDVTDLEFE